MKIIKYVALLVFSCLLLIQAEAQPKDPLSSLRGLSKKELVEILGRPSRSSSGSLQNLEESPRSETLFYGLSQVLFVNGKAVSWSDTGELKARLMRGLAVTSNVGPKWTSWPNPWTPPRAESEEDLLLKLLMGQQDSK